MRSGVVRAVVVSAVTIMVACGGTTPTSPGGSRSSNPSVFVVFTPVGGMYTAQLNGQTYTAAGGFTVNVAPGTHQITGTFRGSGFGVGFAKIGDGGVQSGSLRSLSGPEVQVQACTITYFNIDTPGVQRAFQMQFQVTTNAGSACQGV